MVLINCLCFCLVVLLVVRVWLGLGCYLWDLVIVFYCCVVFDLPLISVFVDVVYFVVGVV